VGVVGFCILFRQLFCVYCVWLGCLSALPPLPLPLWRRWLVVPS
jgi:hypothetical protein